MEQVCFQGAKYPPLTLISSLLSLLQLGQGCGQTLLSTIQLLLNQLDTSVQGSYITLSLGEHNIAVRQSHQVYSNGLKPCTTLQLSSAGLQHPTPPMLSQSGLGREHAQGGMHICYS